MNDELVLQNLDKFRTTLGLKDVNNLDTLFKDLNLKKEFVKQKIEIELLWNQLIFEKYKDKLSIDENKIRNNLKLKINSEKNEIDEYNLSEILFTPSSKGSEKKEIEKIKDSINEVGFEKELDMAIINEKNKQLSQFSSIYFKKVELNTVINEK